MRSGSLFAGYGGLTLAVEDALGATPAWFAEHEPGATSQPAAKVLARRWPDVPNLGDVRRDWSQVPQVDVMDGGYPCPGESAAGLRLGMDDHRWMWPAYYDAIRALRPRLAIGENVRNHLTMSFRWVLADLQSIGYAVVWTVLAASDVGACHGRKRVFWAAYDEQVGPPAGLPSTPFAVLHGGTWGTASLFGHEPLDKLPNAGAAYAGAAPSLPLLKTPTAQLAINGGSQHPDKRREGGHGPTLADQVEHLMPTPRTSDTNGAGAHGDGGLDLRTAVTLLPTPDATHGRKDTRTGPLLAGAVELLPTPTATQAGGTAERHLARKNRNGENRTAVTDLGIVVEQLLPTPSASDGLGGHLTRSGARGDEMLLPGVAKAYADGSLLPTPTRADGDRASLAYGRGNPTLSGALLPTPKATDGTKGGPNQRGSGGDLTLPSAVQPERLLATPRVVATRASRHAAMDERSAPALEQCIEIADGLLPREFTDWAEAPASWQPAEDGGRWGPYAAAIARQEAFSRPAPDPTVIGPKGGRRLNPAFVEWMMWMPAGWFTDVPGVTHNQALKLGGNGVVRAQGAAAVRFLVGRLPAGLLGALPLQDQCDATAGKPRQPDDLGLRDARRMADGDRLRESVTDVAEGGEQSARLVGGQTAGGHDSQLHVGGQDPRHENGGPLHLDGVTVGGAVQVLRGGQDAGGSVDDLHGLTLGPLQGGELLKHVAADALRDIPPVGDDGDRDGVRDGEVRHVHKYAAMTTNAQERERTA